jgi:DnaJ homolog subfamily B member 13
MPTPAGAPQGNLTLEIELLFPTSICEKQRMLLRSAFFLPASLTAAQAKAIKAFEGAFKDQLHGWATGFAKDEQ